MTNLTIPPKYQPSEKPNKRLQEFNSWKAPKITNPKPSQTETKNPEPITPTQVPENYVFIPTINLAFAPEITLQGNNFYNTHKAIIENPEQGRMPTVTETWQAIFYCQNHLGQPKYKNLFDSILKKTPESTWHEEWQNDFYTKDGDKMYVQHLEDFDIDGKPVFSKKTELSDYLKENTWADISSRTMGFPKANLTKQGLCKEKSKKDFYEQGENIYFLHPRDKRVARFGADSGIADLYCGRVPSDSSGSLGVRLVCEAHAPEENGGSS